MDEKLLVSHLPWVGNWRWYSWDSVPHKVTAESQTFQSPFKRLTPEEEGSAEGFLQLIPVSPCLESKKRGVTNRIWSDVRSWKLLVSFPVWNNREGNSAIILSLCARALGNVHVLSTKHSFPCSPRGSLGGHVVWFISLNCQLMNGMRPSTATHSVRRERPPWVYILGVLPFSLGGNQKEIQAHWSFTMFPVCVSHRVGSVWSHYFSP